VAHLIGINKTFLFIIPPFYSKGFPLNFGRYQYHRSYFGRTGNCSSQRIWVVQCYRLNPPIHILKS
jgi:hypothetical protein